MLAKSKTAAEMKYFSQYFLNLSVRRLSFMARIVLYMTKFTAQIFNIPNLKGISAQNISEHLKLYAGYVNNANAALEKINQFKNNPESAYETGELFRRFSFEYNGMRNHEAYFSQFESGATVLAEGSRLREAIGKEWGSFNVWLNEFKLLALTRGVGWAMLWHDPKADRLINSWVDEQHLGQLNGCQIILALDMWEHSYVADYQPSGKKQYIEDFFINLNWKVVDERFR